MPITLITKNKKAEFKPHIAVCHMDAMINGGSANEENDPLVLKSKTEGDLIIKHLKALGKTGEVIEKASYRNLSRQLEEILKDYVLSQDPSREYVWVWVADFDENTVIYEYDGGYKSVGYEVSETGIVALKDEDHKEVIGQTVYTTVDGIELVLKSAEDVSGSEEAGVEGTIVTSDENDDNKENDMSEVILKTKEDVEAFKADILEKAQAKWEADLAEKELNKSATEIVKALGFVAEEDHPVVVKALVGLGIEDAEVMGVVVKSLTAAQEAVEAAQAETAEIKKEFGSAEQVSEEGTPVSDAKSATEIMKQRVANMKAKQAKK